jgi:hypothetical protein
VREHEAHASHCSGAYHVQVRPPARQAEHYRGSRIGQRGHDRGCSSRSALAVGGHTRPFFGHLAPFVKIDDRVLERGGGAVRVVRSAKKNNRSGDGVESLRQAGRGGAEGRLRSAARVSFGAPGERPGTS